MKLYNFAFVGIEPPQAIVRNKSDSTPDEIKNNTRQMSYTYLITCGGMEPSSTRDKKRKTDIESPYYKRNYIYDEYSDFYLCSEVQALKYSITDRNGYRIYKSESNKCKNYPNLKRCSQSKNIQH